MMFLKGCFALDPNNRLTCEELLNHPYFDKYEEIFYAQYPLAAAELQRRSQNQQQMNRVRAQLSRLNNVSFLLIQLLNDYYSTACIRTKYFYFCVCSMNSSNENTTPRGVYM